MKTTVKANNYKQAYEELKVLDATLAEKLSEEIDANDQGHNMVLCIKRHNNEQTQQYETNVSVQAFDNVSFEKLQRDYQFLGFSKIILLHKADGAKVIDLNAEAQAATATAPVAETEEQMRERIAKEFEAKYAGYVPSTPAGNAAASSQAEIEANAKAARKIEFLAMNLNAVKKGDDLHALAKEFEVDVTGLTKVDDVRGALAQFQKDEIEANAKA